jgi:metal-sulfur cluster biosynthetic enzyme
MTSRACPLGVLLSALAEAALKRAVPEAQVVDVRFVWDPPWQPEMMSDAAKRALHWAA